MTPRQRRRVLKDARTDLEEFGWIQGSFRDGDMHCLAGALAEQVPGCDIAADGLVVTFAGQELWLATLAVVGAVLASGELDVREARDRGWLLDMATDWNDRGDTTFGDVLDVLDAALERIPDDKEASV